MNIVNPQTRINHVFIVSKIIYNIEPDTHQMTQKILEQKAWLCDFVSCIEIINIRVDVWLIGAGCQTPDRQQLVSVNIVLWHTHSYTAQSGLKLFSLNFLTQNLKIEDIFILTIKHEKIFCQEVISLVVVLYLEKS